MIDKERLVAWLRERAMGKGPLVWAIYYGLADRIERGDFDKEGGSGDGPHMVQS